MREMFSISAFTVKHFLSMVKYKQAESRVRVSVYLTPCQTESLLTECLSGTSTAAVWLLGEFIIITSYTTCPPPLGPDTTKGVDLTPDSLRAKYWSNKKSYPLSIAIN